MTKQEAKILWIEKIYNTGYDWDEDFRSMAAGFFIALGFTYDESCSIYDELVEEGMF